MTAVAPPPRPVEEQRVPVEAIYQHLSRAERYIHETRDVACLRLLARYGCTSLEGREILEVGCGAGALLRTLVARGAEPARLRAIDIDARKVRSARAAVPGASLAVADGALLPFRPQSFDLVFLFTALSSMIDADVRRHAAHEAMRVLQPGGLAVVYDFWTNPTNANVRPVSKPGLRRLFAPHHVAIERVTLAPVLVRALAGNRVLCRPLERLPFLRTHLLAVVTNRA